MLEVFLKGMGVGLAVAAPVGPIGILCIRRSLSQGRAAGLATGFGAAVADATYGLLVAAGLAATGVLVAFAPQMQLFGGLLITWLGLTTLRGFLSGESAIDTASASRKTVLAAFGSTYVLTLSNPMTILAFIGMIAGLTSASSGAGGAYVLVVGVLLGSALWWVMLVQLALLARGRIASDGLRWLDLLAGVVLAIWGMRIAAGPILDGTLGHR